MRRSRQRLGNWDAAEILQWMARCGVDNMFPPDVEIVGDLDIGDMLFPVGLSFTGVTFSGTLKLAMATVGGALELVGCRFEQGLDCRGITVHGPVVLGRRPQLLDAEPPKTEIRGLVDFSNGHLNGGVHVSKCFLAGPGNPALRLDFAKSGAHVRLENVEVTGGLSARSLDVEGDFLLFDCSIKADPKAVAVSIDFAKSSGDVLFEAVEITGGLSARSLEAEGNLKLSGASIRAGKSNLVPAALMLGDLDIGGSVIIEGMPQKRARIEASESGQAVDLPNGRIRAAISLGEMDTLGNISLHGSTAAGLGLRDVGVGGTFVLSGCRLGFISGWGVRIDGELVLIEGKCGQFRISTESRGETPSELPSCVGGIIAGEWAFEGHVELQFQQIRLANGNKPLYGTRGIYMAGVTCVSSLRITQGKSFLRMAARSEDLGPEAYAVRSQETADPEVVGRWERSGRSLFSYADPWYAGTVCRGPVAIRGCKVAGDLDLTGLRCLAADAAAEKTESESSRPDGPQSESVRTESIRIEDTQIGRRLLMCSPYTYLEESEAGDSLIRAAVEAHHQVSTDPAYAAARKRGEFGAYCLCLSLDGTSANVVDLSGLVLEEPPEEESPSVLSPRSVIARRVKVPDRFTIWQKRPDEPQGIAASRPTSDEFASVAANMDRGKAQEQKAYGQWKEVLSDGIKAVLKAKGGEATATSGIWAAIIPGALNLTKATIGELVISGASFESRRGKPEAKAEEHGIVLDDASIGQLTVKRMMCARGKAPSNGFPAPVSLRDLSVASWQLESNKMESNGKSGAAPAQNGETAEVESTDADDYLDLLDNDEAFHQTTFTSVERYLRERGHDGEARKVYIAGQFRRARVGNKRLWSERKYNGRESKRGLFHFFFRLNRNLSEDVLFVLVLVLCVGVVSLMSPDQGWAQTSSGITAALIALLVCCVGFCTWFWRLTWDRFSWSVLGYGTGPGRLLLVIVSLFALTLFGVARNHNNFERSLAWCSAFANKCSDNSSSKDDPPSEISASQQVQSPKKPISPPPIERDEWGFGHALWATAQANIPLVSLFTEYDWRPKDRGHAELFRRPLRYSAQHWFGMMSILNYILWPLFLPLIVRLLIRENPR